MKILFIGGTGTISSAITRQLLQKGEDLYLLNRGNRNERLPEKAKVILCDINNEKVKKAVPGFVPSIQAEEGLRKTLDFIMSHPEYQVEDPDFDVWCDRVIQVLEQAKASFSMK